MAFAEKKKKVKEKFLNRKTKENVPRKERKAQNLSHQREKGR